MRNGTKSCGFFLSKETSSEKNFGRNEKDGIYDRPVTGKEDNGEKSSSGRDIREQ
jgi:hypothetical protein